MIMRKLCVAGLTVLVIFLTVVVVAPGNVQAATASACDTSSGFLGFPTWYKYLDPVFINGECEIDFNFPSDIGLILAAIVEILLRVATMVAIGFIVWGGLQYIMSQDEPEKTKNALGTIINALIGLVIAVAATGIVTFLAGRF